VAESRFAFRSSRPRRSRRDTPGPERAGANRGGILPCEVGCEGTGSLGQRMHSLSAAVGFLALVVSASCGASCSDEFGLQNSRRTPWSRNPGSRVPAAHGMERGARDRERPLRAPLLGRSVAVDPSVRASAFGALGRRSKRPQPQTSPAPSPISCGRENVRARFCASSSPRL